MTPRSALGEWRLSLQSCLTFRSPTNLSESDHANRRTFGERGKGTLGKGTLLIYSRFWIIWRYQRMLDPRWPRHAPNRWVLLGRLLVSCPQSGERAGDCVSEALRFRRVPRPDGRVECSHSDAHPRLLPYAQSLPPGPLAARGRRCQPLDALADDNACAPPPGTLSVQRSCLAGTVQSISNPGR